MTDLAIPPASLQRLRASLQQFQDLGQVVAEAMGLANQNVRLDLERGVFVLDEQSEVATNGAVKSEATV